MNIKQIRVENLLFFRRYLSGLIFSLFLLLSLTSFGQTPEAEKNFAQCKACHTIGGGQLVGPDLKGVTEKHSEEWLIKFIQNSQAMIQAGDEEAVKVFNENNKIPMPSHSLTDEQVKDILLYIKNGGKIPGAEQAVEETVNEKASVQQESEAERYVKEKREAAERLAVFAIIALILMILIIFDLAVTHFIKAKWIMYVLLLSAVWILMEWSWDYATSLGRQTAYQPDQPIWFSHKVHAGQNKIDCEYCHFTAERSMHAGIPPASVCMNCHNQVREGSRTGKEEIAKIYEAIEKKEPIQWVKVHNLPDFVYFNHEQHVKVGKLDCTECHGNVEEMDQVAQVEDLSMGWCLDCHRSHKVQFVDNKFYDSYKKYHEKLKKGELGQVTVKMIGGEDCAKCHY